MPGYLFDTSTWLAASFTSHSFHAAAQNALLRATAPAPAVFCRATQQSFLRLATTPALLRAYGAAALTHRDAVTMLATLQAFPQVSEREEPPGVVALWHRLAARDSASPKVWMDAYLAAFAICGALRMVTLDGDFRQYESSGLKLDLLTAA